MDKPSKDASPNEWVEWRKAEKAQKHFAEVHAQFVQGRASEAELQAAGEAVDAVEEEEVTAESILEEFGLDHPVGADRDHGHSHDDGHVDEATPRPDRYEEVLSSLSSADPAAELTGKYQTLAKAAQALKPNDPRRADVVEVLAGLQAEANAKRDAVFSEKASEAFALAAKRKGEAFARKAYEDKRQAELDTARDLARRLGPYDRGTVAEREAEYPPYDDLNPAKRDALVKAGIDREYQHVADYAQRNALKAPPELDTERRYSRSEFEDVMRASREDGTKIANAGLVDWERR